MRIALLTTEYPTAHSSSGGIGSNAHRTAVALSGAGHEVEVFTLAHSRLGSKVQVLQDPVVIHCIPPHSRWENTFRTAPLLRRYQGWGKVLSRAGVLAGALRARHRAAHFDLIQAASSHGCGLLMTFRRVAPVVTFANSHKPAIRAATGRTASRKELQADRAAFWQMRRSDAVHAPSQLVASLLAQQQGIRAEVIEYPYDLTSLAAKAWPIPEGVSAESYGLYFGTLSRLKGVDRLVRVLPELLQRHEDFRFVFIGRSQTGPDGRPFDEYLRDRFRPYSGRVTVHACLPQDELFRYVANARLVVLPSRMDNLPNTCLEAMILARLVVAARGASFEQLINHEQTGFLASQDDDDDLSAQMDRAWRMPATERRRMGQLGKTSLARFQSSSAIRPLLDLYENAIQARGSQ